MGQYASKCCKKATLEESEKVPLVNLEKGGKATDKNAAEEDVSGTPIEPDPAVFYAKSTPHSARLSSRGGGKRERGRGRHDQNDTARETGSSTSAKRNKHHHRSKEKVGEETILRFHKDHPNEAPLRGSSSEEDEDVDGTGTKTTKNWIGVCSARMQHCVWWYSVTFVLCLIVGVGCYFGFTLSFDSTKEGRMTPPPPGQDVVHPEPDPHASGGVKKSSSSSTSSESESASSPPLPPPEDKGHGVDEENGAGVALGGDARGGRRRREIGSRGYGEGTPASRWTSAVGNHDHDLDLDRSSSKHPSSRPSSKSSPRKKPPPTKTSTSMNEYEDVVDDYDGGGDGVAEREGRGEEGVGGAEQGRANSVVRQGGGALRSRKMTPGGGGGGRGASGVRSDVAGGDSRRRKSGVGDSSGGGGGGGGLPSTENIEEDPDVKDAVKDAVSRLLRKQFADIAKERDGSDPTNPASSGDVSSSASP